MTRTRMLSIALALLMLPLVSLATVAESAPTSGGPVAISADTTWDADGDLDAQVVVESGATLTIAADVSIDVQSGASLTVAHGATLIMESGSALEADVDTYPMYTNAYQSHASLTLDADAVDDGFDITFHSHGDSNLSNWAVEWNGFSEDMEGDSHTISFASAPEQDIRFDFEMIGWAWNALIIDNVEVQEGIFSSETLSPTDMSPNSFFLWEDATWSLDIAGSATLTDAEVAGADMQITGTVSLSETKLTACGPVAVSGPDGSLTTVGGHIMHSHADHDVRADGVSSLTWGAETEGSGGVVDRWERIIPAQTVHVPANSVGIKFHDPGPSEENTNPYLSGIDGNLLVRGGGERTVEIGWSNGTVWTESAYMTIDSFVTAWNAQPHMPSYGEGQTIPLTWDAYIDLSDAIDLPMIEISEVAPLATEGTTGTSIEVRLSIRNTGEAPARVALECFTDFAEGTRADISPSWPAIDVAAGETNSTTVRWSHADAAEESLECQLATPLQLVESDSFGQSLTEGATVTWSAEVDDGMNMAPILVALGVAIVIGLLVAMRVVQAGPAVGHEDETAEADEVELRPDKFALFEAEGEEAGEADKAA